MKRTRQANTIGNLLISCIKIILVACILTAVLVLLLALSMKWEWISIERVDAVNTGIKALSACFTGFLTSKLTLRRSWLVAGALGMLYMALSFLIFSILNGSFRLSVENVSDVLMAFACASCTCIAAGIISEQFGNRPAAATKQRSSRAPQ